MRRVRLTVAVLLSASLVLAGCSKDDQDPDAGPATQEVSEGTTIDATWPLTGLEATGKQNPSQKHPVLITKLDNTSSSAPQIGLSKADLVVEELVEGGLTRLAAFFYSELPAEVGPVRSMRASDIGIVSPVDGSVVTSGASGGTIARIRGAGIPFFQEGAKGLYRSSDRSAPYNVFANLLDVTSVIKQKSERPQDYLPWGEAADLPKGQKARTIAAQLLRGSHHQLDLPQGRLRQREHPRGGRRRVPRRQRAGAAGAGR